MNGRAVPRRCGLSSCQFGPVFSAPPVDRQKLIAKSWNSRALGRLVSDVFVPVLTTLQPAVTTHTHEPLRTTASTGQMTALKDRVNLDCKSRLGPFREAAMSRPAKVVGWEALVPFGGSRRSSGTRWISRVRRRGLGRPYIGTAYRSEQFDLRCNSLNNLSCPSSTFCVGVGSYDGFYQPHDRDMDGTLAEEWNGSSWSMFETPNPAMPGFNEGYESSFSGVSCTSSTSALQSANPRSSSSSTRLQRSGMGVSGRSPRRGMPLTNQLVSAECLVLHLPSAWRWVPTDLPTIQRASSPWQRNGMEVHGAR